MRVALDTVMESAVLLLTLQALHDSKYSKQ